MKLLLVANGEDELKIADTDVVEKEVLELIDNKQSNAVDKHNNEISLNASQR
jgi:hypothetical protein